MDFSINDRNGFTLVETIIAMFILVVGIMSLYTMQISSIKGNTQANRITLGTSWGKDGIEDLLLTKLRDIPDAFAVAAIKDLDRNNDGNGKDNQDTDKNGFDNEGVDGVANFGLDNTVGPDADFTRASPDGRFTVYYNFAIDVPLPRTVTVRVIIQENNTATAPVVLTYMKDDII